MFLQQTHEAFSKIGKNDYESSKEVMHTLQTLNMSNVRQGETIELLPQPSKDQPLYPPFKQ